MVGHSLKRPVPQLLRTNTKVFSFSCLPYTWNLAYGVDDAIYDFMISVNKCSQTTLCHIVPAIPANNVLLLAKIQIVDQTAELENFYSIDEPEPLPERPAFVTRPKSSADSTVTVPPLQRTETTNRSPSQQSTSRADTALRSPASLSPVSFDNILTISGTKRRRTNDSVTSSDPYRHVQLPPISQEIHKQYVESPSGSSFQGGYANSYGSPTEANETTRIEQEYARISDNLAAQIPDEPFLSVSSWKKYFRWPNQYTTQQCRCLFRYYIEVLGPWVRVLGNMI